MDNLLLACGYEFVLRSFQHYQGRPLQKKLFQKFDHKGKPLVKLSTILREWES